MNLEGIMLVKDASFNGPIPYNSIYMTFRERQNYRETVGKVMTGCPQVGVGRRCDNKE